MSDMIKKIENILNPEYMNTVFTWHQIKEAIESVEHRQKADGWISVECRLPEDMEDVFACHIDAGGIEKCFYDKRKQKWFPTDAGENNERLVTHWQPLPALPLQSMEENKSK